jgi:membrane protease YdiL (CAAX protease family)
MQQEPTPQKSDGSISHSLRGFGATGILFTLVVVLLGNVMISEMVMLPLGAILVLIWVQTTKTPWSAIGYNKPKSWAAVVAIGIVSGIALKFFLKALVLPLLGAPPVNQAYQFLAGNNALLPAAIWTMLAAGFGEETVYRGFLFERFESLLGRGREARLLILAITSFIFSVAHYSQGIPGIEQAAFTGLIFGVLYAMRQNIWVVMISHASFDLTALALIHWNLEARVAHMIFKG